MSVEHKVSASARADGPPSTVFSSAPHSENSSNIKEFDP